MALTYVETCAPVMLILMVGLFGFGIGIVLVGLLGMITKREVVTDGRSHSRRRRHRSRW